MRKRSSRAHRRNPPALQEIVFLLDFINTGGTNDYRLSSDSLREVFFAQHRIDQRTATPKLLSKLEKEIIEALRAVAKRRRPSLGEIYGSFKHARGQHRLVVADEDLSSRLRSAVEALRKARLAIRECRLCPFPFFFRPRSNDKYCPHCRASIVAIAEKLEQAETRMAKSRMKKLAASMAAHQRWTQALVALNKRLDAAQTHGNQAMIQQCRKRISAIEDSPRWRRLEAASTRRVAGVAPPRPTRRATEPVSVYVGDKLAYEIPSRTYADILKDHRADRSDPPRN